MQWILPQVIGQNTVEYDLLFVRRKKKKKEKIVEREFEQEGYAKIQK